MATESHPWKLRLLCSVDVIGSTAYKGRFARSLAPEWAHKFKAFYQEFPEKLESSYANLPKGITVPETNERFSVWKFVGDEILFAVELPDYRHTLAHVCALKLAVTDYNRVTWAKEALNLKASAWVAGFPVLNTEVGIQREDDRCILDYIGPSIDAGFRIAKFATEQRFVMSADLAFLVLDAILAEVHVDSPCELFFEGLESLRGVLGGTPYPIVWINMHSDSTTEVEALAGITREPPQPDKLRSFLLRFLEGTDGVRKPFIQDDRGGRYDKVPPEFEEARKRIIAQQEQSVVNRKYDETKDDADRIGGRELSPGDLAQRSEIDIKPPEIHRETPTDDES